MHKLYLAIIFLLLSGLAAFAQGGGSTYNWTGFYVGANIYASRDSLKGPDVNFTIQQISNLFVTGRGIVIVPGTTRPETSSGNATKWGGGGHAGYQWQTGHWVFGPEFEFDPSRRSISILDTTTLPPTALQPPSVVTAQQSYRMSQDMFFRGRVGYAFNKTLIYGNGGYANTNLRITTVGTFTDPGGLAPGSGPPQCNDIPSNPCFNGGPEGPTVNTVSGEHRRNGWTVGGGFDQAISKRLSIGAEYRHTQFNVGNNFTADSSSFVNTGPEAHGTNGGTGTLGRVDVAPAVTKIHSDAVNFRFDFHF